MASNVKKKKKEKRHIERGHAHIQSSFNNTLARNWSLVVSNRVRCEGLVGAGEDVVVEGAELAGLVADDPVARDDDRRPERRGERDAGP